MESLSEAHCIVWFSTLRIDYPCNLSNSPVPLTPNVGCKEKETMAYGVPELELGGLLVIPVLIHVISTVDSHPEADNRIVKGV